MLRHLDLFSGIGGFAMAAQRLGGFETVQFVEIDPFCQQVLGKHWPGVPIHRDVKTYAAQPGNVDVITAGFPCQDLSSAGKQAGLRGIRSGLFYEVLRLARELRPRFLVLENVANLVSHANGTTFQEVLFQIARAGFDAEWAVISAQDLGACHLRKRVWVVAYSSGADGGRRPEGTGRGQRGAADADGCEISEGGRGAEQSAHAAHMLSDGGPGQQQGQPQGRSVSKSGDGDRADAADSGSQHLQRRGASWQRLFPASGVEKGAVWSSKGILRLDSRWRSYVSEPFLRRGDDGLSGRVDRLKALGNAVVPQVAMVPLARVLELAYDEARAPA